MSIRRSQQVQQPLGLPLALPGQVVLNDAPEIIVFIVIKFCKDPCPLQSFAIRLLSLLVTRMMI